MGSMKTFPAMDVAGAAMAAERRRLEIIAANIANANTLVTPEGGPYRRREAVFESFLDKGGAGALDLPSVRVASVVEDGSPFRRVLMPGHPLADEQGYVAMPNVDIVYEMVDLMAAMRSYESNLKTVEALRQMYGAALEIGRA